MLFNINISKKCCASVVAIATLLPLFVFAQGMEVAEQDLAQAKDAFNEVWHAAAETTKKRTALQEDLASFDAKVAEAKQELDSASKNRAVVREKIDAKQTLVDALRGQLNAVVALRGLYQSVVDTHRQSFIHFVRFIASKDIAETQAGPVFGGGIIRLLQHGSLGERTDDAIARMALLKAKRQLRDRAKVLAEESHKAEERLHAVAGNLDRELSSLMQEHSAIADTAKKAADVIDLSWKEKKLTQEELAAVAAEAAETNARVAEIQSSLVKINEQLKERVLNVLKDQMKTALGQTEELKEQRNALTRKDDAMKLLEDAALRAFQETVNQRNSDPKLYKRTEERTLQLTNAEQTLETGLVNREDVIGETRPITDAERAKLADDTERLKAQVALMKNGVPEDIALQYVDAKRRADSATEARKKIAEDLDALKPKFAEVEGAMSSIAEKIGKAEKEYELGNLPPLFTWPVRGPITAGYLDAAYVGVFHVPHRAIDIAVPQGSIVHSIADGIVFAVHDGGATGFSYVLIGHRNGYASLYGHVSSFLVSKGDVVTMDQPIALSGGTPGTHGAGRMTTGAHVHLEVTLDGEHIDPRSILK